MKTEKDIIDDLGEWLCKDMERTLLKAVNPRMPPSIDKVQNLMLIRDAIERIRFYRDNCLNI